MFAFHQTMVYFHILLYAFIAPCTQTLGIQHQLTVEPFQNKAPYDEVISVEHSINKRSIKELSIKAKINGTDREFILQSAEGFFAGKDTKIWLAERVAPNATKLKYTLQKDIMEKVNITFYRDRKTQSAITSIINEEGFSELNGVIDFDKTISPFEKLIRKRRDVPSKSFESNNTTLKNDHIIQNRASNKSDVEFARERFSLHLQYLKAFVEPRRKSSLGVPHILYPEILVYVDKSLFEYFKKDIVKTVAYTLTLWNGVDLYFRELENPKVRLNIAGIVLCQDQIIPMEPFTIGPTTLALFAKFMYNEEKFKLSKDYDISVLLKSKVMLTPYIQGKAFLGKACLSNEIHREVQSTAIIVDDTNLAAIHHAAHVLAHLFGAVREGNEPIIFKRGRSVIKCSEADGFLMSNNRLVKNRFHFSPCSQTMMSYFFSLKGAECLRNNPADNRTDDQILRILPGKYMSLDKQCQKMGYTEVHHVNSNPCVIVRCLLNKSDVSLIPAIEGSPCDFGKFCLRGECVEVPLNEETRILFPSPYYQILSGFNKSSGNQCLESNIKKLISSTFVDCTVNCLFLSPSGELMLETLLAQDGTSCGTNGYCYRKNCVDGNSGSIINKEVVTITQIDTGETDNVTED